MNRETIISADRLHRVTLWRQIEGGNPDQFLLMVGLNPSTADETKDDPTIRRCKSFAADIGVGWLCMMNLFTLRATNPAVMLASSQPNLTAVNDFLLSDYARQAYMTLAAWGTHGGHMGRDRQVIATLSDTGRPVYCLGTTQTGFPRHPLYIPGGTIPQRYAGRASDER